MSLLLLLYLSLALSLWAAGEKEHCWLCHSHCQRGGGLSGAMGVLRVRPGTCLHCQPSFVAGHQGTRSNTARDCGANKPCSPGSGAWRAVSGPGGSFSELSWKAGGRGQGAYRAFQGEQVLGPRDGGLDRPNQSHTQYRRPWMPVPSERLE